MAASREDAAMPRPTLLAASILLAAAAVLGAQEGGLRYEKTVAFQRDRVISLDARVGPVLVSQVQFSEGAAGGMRDTILSRVKGGGDSDTTTLLRASFDSENPKD